MTENPNDLNHEVFPSRQSRYLILFILWIMIYLIGLGSLELKGEEGRRILPAHTMLKTGNWTVPYVGGEPYYNKPPLINWLVALSFRLTGVENEWSARLPSALFMLAFVSLLYWMSSAWLSEAARFLGCLVFMTAIGILEKGRLIEIEGLYICLSGMALLWWGNLFSMGGHRWLMWTGAGLFLAAGMLTKGPPILLFFYLPVLGVLWKSRQLKELICRQHALCLLILFGLSYLWVYAVRQQGDPGAMADSMGSQLSSRIFIRHIDFPYLLENFLKSFLNFLPWLLFIPMFWDRKLVDAIPEKYRPVYLGLRFGTVVSFLIIALMPGTEDRYTLPALAPVSILLGLILSVYTVFSKADRVWNQIIIGGFILACIGGAAAVLFVSFSALTIGAFLVTLAVVARVWSSRKLLCQTGVRVQATAFLVGVFVLLYSVTAPVLAKGKESRRPVAAKINEVLGDEETLYVYKPGYQAFLFYVREPYEYVLEPGQIDDRVRFLLIESAPWQEFTEGGQINPDDWDNLYEFQYREKGRFKLMLRKIESRL